MSDQETVQAGVEDTDPADITSRDEILQPKERDEAVSGSINESQSSKLLPQCSPLEGAQRGAADEEKDDDQDLNPEKDVGLELSRDVEANAKPNDISDIADAEYWQATPVVNMDGLEGSGLRAGAYVARYGGGDDFRAVDPLLSAEILRRSAEDCPGWQQACCALAEVTMDSIQLIHGFSDAAILDAGNAPTPREVEWANPQILVTRAPNGSDYFSMMLHGWLFPDFAQSDRKGHQKFPLLTVFCSEGSNLRHFDPAETSTKLQGNAAEETYQQNDGAVWVPPHLRYGEPPSLPRWIPTAGKPHMTWADQHVHRDEPIDLGGFLFREVFFGSDMARVAVQEKELPAFFWLTAVDVEAKRGLRSFCIIIPSTVPPLSARAVEMNERSSGLFKVCQVSNSGDASDRSDEIHTCEHGGCRNDGHVATDVKVASDANEAQSIAGDNSPTAGSRLSDPPPRNKVPRNDGDGTCKATSRSQEDELDAILRNAKTIQSIAQGLNQHWGKTCADNMLRVWQA